MQQPTHQSLRSGTWRACCNQWCKQEFEITDDDLRFYEKVSPEFGGKKYAIPPPTLCPGCRAIRRFAWRNERNLYKRPCSLCTSSIVSLYDERTGFPVYCAQCFWGDGWDPLSFAVEYDKSRPFLESFLALQKLAPRISLLNKNSENSDYTNHASQNKNCYLSSVIFNCEDVFHSRKIYHSRSIGDCLYIFHRSELLYECFWGEYLYNCTFCRICISCTDCHFCFNCKGCTDCFLSTNLRNQSYIFKNEQCSKEEYQQKMREYQSDSYAAQQETLTAFDSICKSSIHPALHLEDCEDATGDFLVHCNRVRDCYYSSMGQDCRYCIEFDRSAGDRGSVDCMDAFGFGASELLYEVQAQANGYHNIVSNFSYDVRECLYCDNCHDCEHCFGCIGLRGKQRYCILNKQYTKEEYEALVPKIIEKMRANGEWGEFFDVSLSPFGYNETVAQDHSVLTREEALQRGWHWNDEEPPMPKAEKIIPASKLPDSINQIPDDILNWAMTCEVTGKPFNIIKQELDFYRQMNLPVPRLHPDERHKRRMAQRNPRKLWDRNCAKCRKPIATSYSPDRPEIVYCEECYLKEVY